MDYDEKNPRKVLASRVEAFSNLPLRMSAANSKNVALGTSNPNKETQYELEDMFYAASKVV